MNPIFPSILSTNFFNLESKLKDLESNKIEFIHLDVMDGHFVETISFGPSLLKALKSEFNFKVDAHLMVTNPSEMIPKFIQNGAEWISFHFEAQDNIEKNINLIKNNDRKAGLVLNPDTEVNVVFPFLERLDYVLLMSVYPGKGGQKFIESTIPKVSTLKERIDKKNYNCLIQVDGGINASNIDQVKAAGGDLFVVGTFLYNSNDITQTLYNINNKINGA